MPSALISEDEPLLAAALAAELARLWPELTIVAQLADGLSAARQARALQPDVCFLDIQSGKVLLTLRGRPERPSASRLYAPLFKAM